MDYGTPSFLFLHILFIGFFSSDDAELSEHSCSTDYSQIFADLALQPLANAVAFLLQEYCHDHLVEFPFKIR